MPRNNSEDADRVILADDNYEEWVEYISPKLKSEGCYGIATGVVKELFVDPDPAAATDAQRRSLLEWQKSDEKGQGVMELSMSVANRRLIKGKTSAGAWHPSRPPMER